MRGRQELRNPFPEHAGVCKHRLNPVRIPKPGKIGTNRRSDEYILRKIHSKIVFPKELLQKVFKAEGLGAVPEDFLRDFVDNIDVVLR